MSLSSVTASAPTRIDLAGGTLDIWPINLLFDGAVTLNMAIDIRVSVEVKARKGSRILLISDDRKLKKEFSSLNAVHHRHGLALLSRVVKNFLEPGKGVSIRTKSDAPAGAGLAGSSALNIALCGALARFTGVKLSHGKLIDTAKDIEAGLLKVPTGLQDYGAAVYGGVNAFTYPPGGMKRETLTGAEPVLERRTLLFYSGAERVSGVNNWEMMKRVIDGDKKTITRFQSIARYARCAVNALKENDVSAFDKAVNNEWKARREIFPAISTPVIDKAIKAGRKAGATAARICGAGGGGCFFIFAEPEKREAITRAVESAGPRRLSFKLSKKGLTIYNH